MSSSKRIPLNADRIAGAAVALADESGLDAVTMRAAGERLGVEAMALYRHVSGKDALLAGLADHVVREVVEACAGLPEPTPGPGEDWRDVARRRILTARTVVLRHPWFPALMGERGAMTPAFMRYFDDLSGILLAGGLSPDLLHRGIHALGSRALGYTQELFSPASAALADPKVATAALEAVAAEIPNIMRMMESVAHDTDTTVGWCDDQAEFEFGLELTLDGLEHRRELEGRAAPA